jgi:hypothetical protein
MRRLMSMSGLTIATIALTACGSAIRGALPAAGSATGLLGPGNSPPQAAVTLNPVVFVLSKASISKTSKSITITLDRVNGKRPPKGVKTTVSVNLTKCRNGCKVSGPGSPAGRDTFTLTIVDQAAGKKGGKALATGSVTAAVKSGKTTSVRVTLPKIPAFLTFGTVPSASAGTALPATALPLTVADADKNAIVGAYSAAITVSDSDTSSITQGSFLSVSGGAPARTVILSKSSDVLQLGYGGLAIAAVTLTASASNVSSATASFAPALPPIAYSGPMVNSAPEIDLYSTNGANPGYSASFTLTQAGWNSGSFASAFTYTLGGSNNNCTSYAVSPASGTSSTYTVTVASSPAAGKCTLTATGGAGLTLTVLLTYTTSGVVAN